MPVRRGPYTRRTALLVVLGVGVGFLAGLVVHGVVGGILLLAVAATLAWFSRAAWTHVRREGHVPRLLIVAVVVALAVAKFAGKL